MDPHKSRHHPPPGSAAVLQSVCKPVKSLHKALLNPLLMGLIGAPLQGAPPTPTLKKKASGPNSPNNKKP